MPTVTPDPKRPTIYDVAREAGVAPSTVSRAFTTPGRVSDRTRARVLEAARRVSYTGRYPIARTFARRRTETIALPVPDITNVNYMGLITGAARRAAAAGYLLVLADSEESVATEKRLIDTLAQSVDGIVLGASRLSDDDLVEIAKTQAIVLVNRDVPGIPCVVADQQHSVDRLIEHLASLGHRDLAYLAGPRTSWTASRRWEVLATASVRRGLRIVRMGPFPPFLSGGAAATDAFLASGATAAVTHNGMLGIGVLRELAARGIAVPDQLSVAACDDLITAEFFTPPLTARAGPMMELGRTAVSLLLDRFERLEAGDYSEPATGTIVLPAELVVRGSTGPVPDGTRRPTRP
jgi:DNA-binding LacI/PurR family transcriptional regulator